MDQELRKRFDRLEDTRAALLLRMEGRDSASLNRPRPDGGWSALQVLHHVIAAEEGTLRYISKKMQAGTSLPRAGVASRLRLLALQLANAGPFRFKAPAVTAQVPAEIDPDQLRARWDAVRTDWAQRLEGFPDELLDRMVFRHAMVGLMGLPDALSFLQSHLAHHAGQVERLLSD